MNIKIQKCTLRLRIKKPRLRELFFIVKELGRMRKVKWLKRKAYYKI